MSALKAFFRTIVSFIARPLWRRVWFRVETRVTPIDTRLMTTESRMARLDDQLQSLDKAWQTHLTSFLNAVASVPAMSHEVAGLTARLNKAAPKDIEARLEQLHSRIKLLDHAWETDAPKFLNAAQSIPAISHEILALSDRLTSATATPSLHADALKDVHASIAALWDRIEFVRAEFLFELNHGSKRPPVPNTTSDAANVVPRIISVDKVKAMEAAGDLRLNLGCGHLALPGYINIDARELPGVDVVADVANLPFDAGTVTEIFSAHLIEHFPRETMRRQLLPYWRSRLSPSGIFRAVTPDAAAMLSATATASMSFDDFREVMYGAQDYMGDFHFNIFSPETLTTLLKEAGFEHIEVPVSGRRNGKCFEFEIIGTPA